MSKSAKAFAAFAVTALISTASAQDVTAEPNILLPAGYQGEAGFGLGRAATPEEIAIWDIDVRPDGQGLPKGRGDVTTGEEIFTESCAACHGDFGEGRGRWPALAGGRNTLTDQRPVKTIGSYWPYLSTVWDYVHRAMPFGNAQSLTDDDVYALTAYLLYLNDLVDEDFELSDANFSEITLPNADNFIPDDREEVEMPLFTAEACMTDCKPEVKITARAAVVDVTPEEAAARATRTGKPAPDAAQAAPAIDESGAIIDNGASAPASESAPEAPSEAEPEAATEEAATDMPAEPDPALVAEGEKVFRKCKACHQVGDSASNRTGPVLNGIVGAPAAHAEGFRYSDALKQAAEDGLVWTEKELSAFLEKPRSYLKGTKMSFGGLRKDSERAAIIAYLATFR